MDEGAQRGAIGIGTVYLVGVGPGDPGLLTLRAAELLSEADAVVHDARMPGAILRRRAPTAEVHELGGAGGGTPTPEEVARLLAQLAGSHPQVVRLAAGDPFAFGGGAEEVAALAEAGVPYEIVPGLMEEAAAAACAGIPLTHRGLARSVTLARDAEGLGDEEWARLAAAETLVVALGRGSAAAAADRLLAAGRSPETPAALVYAGASPRQRTTVTTLDALRVGGEEDAGFLVVGEVVRLRARLAWFESRPLFGQRAVITRALEQAGDFARALERLGAEIVPFPTIRITDPSDPEPLRRAVRDADGYDWIVFTSVNGVERFWRELRAGGGDTRRLAGVSLCAIGPATAAALELEGARADLVPREFVAEAVIEALAEEGDLRGKRILLPRAEVARSGLPAALRARGAEVDDVPAYRTVPAGSQAEVVRRMLEAGEVDLITFTASSTVRNFVDLLGTEIGAARVACIGPITAGTARDAGLRVDVEPEEYTIPGLVSAIREHYLRERSGR